MLDVVSHTCYNAGINRKENTKMAPPSQRDVKKRAFSVSFEKDLIAEIERICEENGKCGVFKDRTAFIKQAAKEKLERLNKEKENNQK